MCERIGQVNGASGGGGRGASRSVSRVYEDPCACVLEVVGRRAGCGAGVEIEGKRERKGTAITSGQN